MLPNCCWWRVVRLESLYENFCKKTCASERKTKSHFLRKLTSFDSIERCRGRRAPSPPVAEALREMRQLRSSLPRAQQTTTMRAKRNGKGN